MAISSLGVKIEPHLFCFASTRSRDSTSRAAPHRTKDVSRIRTTESGGRADSEREAYLGGGKEFVAGSESDRGERWT